MEGSDYAYVVVFSCIRIVRIKITVTDYCISANGFPNSELLYIWLRFVV